MIDSVIYKFYNLGSVIERQADLSLPQKGGDTMSKYEWISIALSAGNLIVALINLFS